MNPNPLWGAFEDRAREEISGQAGISLPPEITRSETLTTGRNNCRQPEEMIDAGHVLLRVERRVADEGG